MKKRIFDILLKIAFGIMVFFIGGCQSDFPDPTPTIDDPIVFRGSLKETSRIKTRATDLDSVYISSDPFNMEFYMELNCPDSNEPNGVYSQLGTYVIPSGYEGLFESKANETPLDWHNLDSEHTFYSWNLPWNPEGIVEPTLQEVPVHFYNSIGENEFEIYRNNEYLENFVGAKSAPFVYKDHGKYVGLTFYHLVSKITIDNFILIETDGSIQEDLKANITFIGMPTSATFYPHPSDNGRPRVDHPIWSPDSGVSYYINNAPNKEDIFYVCPEIDFRNVDFQIELTSADYALYKTYYGTFDDVQFIRKEGSAYDKGEGIDDKILHAGEEMTLNITLIPGIGPGLSIVIQDWSTDKPTDSQFHTYPGLYTESELGELRDAFLRQRKVDGKITTDELEELWEMYGVLIDGKKYFRLYNNLQLTGSYSNIFPVWKDYILDGMGHTIRMTTNRGSFAGWEPNSPYFNCGPCRDIYFSDGTYTIYIDNNGYVWVTDPDTGELKITENKLEDLNTYEGGRYNSYDINAKTGQIRYSEYFNNNISG